MSPVLVFGIAAGAGGVGAALRFFIDGVVKTRVRSSFPWGTALINVSGSFALGLLVAVTATYAQPQLLTVLGTGLLGGYTTFSTASVETVRLALDHRYRAALVNSFGVLASCTAAALLGIWMGGLF